jgi:hypothetical protein
MKQFSIQFHGRIPVELEGADNNRAANLIWNEMDERAEASRVVSSSCQSINTKENKALTNKQKLGSLIWSLARCYLWWMAM